MEPRERWAALTRRQKSAVTGAGLAAVLVINLMQAKPSATPVIAQGEIVPPTAVITAQLPTGEPGATAPFGTSGPAASETAAIYVPSPVIPTEVQPTATPVMAPTPTPSPSRAPTARISFATNHEQTPGNVTLQGVKTRFEPNGNISWLVSLPPASGTERIDIEVTSTDGHVVYSGTHNPEAGSNTYFGRAAIAPDPGVYVMRYHLNGVVIAEGTFTVDAAPVATPTPTEVAICDPSYPTVCIPPRPPELDCRDIQFEDFRVRGDDPHGFDADGDGRGCEPFEGREPTAKPRPTDKPRNNPPRDNCDPSYPTLCLPSSPDLDCGDINARRFPVRGRDPHGFDGDGDGIGCESG